MKKIQGAIDKIRESSLLLIGGKPKQYSQYKKIEPSGTVKQAWKNVGESIQTILDEIEGKDTNDKNNKSNL